MGNIFVDSYDFTHEERLELQNEITSLKSEDTWGPGTKLNLPEYFQENVHFYDDNENNNEKFSLCLPYGTDRENWIQMIKD